MYISLYIVCIQYLRIIASLTKIIIRNTCILATASTLFNAFYFLPGLFQAIVVALLPYYMHKRFNFILCISYIIKARLTASNTAHIICISLLYSDITHLKSQRKLHIIKSNIILHKQVLKRQGRCVFQS